LIWIQYAKFREETRKQNKKKKKEEKNIQKGQGAPFRPRSEKEPVAHLAKTPNRYLPLPLTLADTWTPPVSIILSTVSPLSLETAGRDYSLFNTP
jgi:hypothetical protein